MTLSFKTTIMLGVNEVPTYRKVQLHQKIHSHHILEVRIPKSVFEINDRYDYLGEALSIEIETNTEQKKVVGRLRFKGIVTGIKIVQGSNTEYGDEIVISASSKEIVSNDGPHYNCFHKMGLDDIVKKAFDSYDFESVVDSTNKSVLNYTVQHHESAYEFVKRLAEKYGEWFYYNGKKLVFGKPGKNNTKLKHNYDLSEFSISLNPQPQKFNYFTQSYLDEKKGSKKQSYKTFVPNKSGVSGKNSIVFDKSNKIFKNETNVWINSNNLGTDKNGKTPEKDLKEKVKAQQQSFALNQVRITGRSSNSGVAIGNTVEIDDEKYRIVEVVHSLNDAEDYENHFEAVNANIEGYPFTNISSFPVSQSQMAIVKENSDPQELGRIRVAFAWQDLIGEMTPWIRVVSAHAGENQGIQFIPEIGDEVIVDFEGGDAECPYVIGALYHTGNKPHADWNSEYNNIKVIRTRSGNTIELDDTMNEEKISIYTKNDECRISLDVKEKTLTINAMESIDITAQNISIKARENITIAAENNIDAIANGELAIRAEKDATIKGMNLALEGMKDVSLKGGANAKVKADAMAELSGGGSAKISSSGITEVSGSTLKLN